MPASQQENYRSGGGQFRPAKGGQFGPAETDFFYRRKVVNLDRRGLDTLSVLSNNRTFYNQNSTELSRKL